MSAARFVTVHDIDLRTAEGAARLRADSNLRLLDALQAASAAEAACDVLLTNDKTFRQVTAPRVVLVDDLLASDS